MLLNETKGSEKEMTENEDYTDKVRQKGGPETAVNIGDNSDSDKCEADI
jgi:hypothetical protein